MFHLQKAVGLSVSNSLVWFRTDPRQRYRDVKFRVMLPKS